MSFLSKLFTSAPQSAAAIQSQPSAPRGPSAVPLVLCSSEERVTLLELFTSEGCSSCPPAESWFRQLRARSDLWTRVVPVALHVDYWNRLGWADSLSSPAFTSRQHRYAEEWDSSRVYTPEFVLNGREWRRPSNLLNNSRASLDTAPTTLVGKLTAEQTGSRRFTVSFTPTTGSAYTSKLKVTAALLANGVEHRVTAGENRGERLVHDFAALSVVEAGMEQHSATYTATVQWPASNQQTATSLSVAFWVSTVGSQAPIQSVGGDLL